MMMAILLSCRLKYYVNNTSQRQMDVIIPKIVYGLFNLPLENILLLLFKRVHNAPIKHEDGNRMF